MVNTRSSASLSSGADNEAKRGPKRVEDAEFSEAESGLGLKRKSKEAKGSKGLEKKDLEEEDDAPKRAKRAGKASKGKDGNEPMFYQGGSEDTVLTVYHSAIRGELLAAAAQLGHYDFPPPRGIDINDVTSFLPSQKSWGPMRANYPEIIFQYKPLGRRNPSYEPEEWYHGGRLVVDRDGRPMLHWRDIPDVLSSQYPGYAMEAIERIDGRISHRDFLIRMPDAITKLSSTGDVTMKPLVQTNLISARMNRFRNQAGCLAWNDRAAGSEGMSRFLEKHLPEHLKRANTTLGFRDLEKFEIVDLQLKSLGKHGERSRFHDPAATKKYIEDTKARARRLRAASGVAPRSDNERDSDSEEHEHRDEGSVHTEDAEWESDSLDAARFMKHSPEQHDGGRPDNHQAPTRPVPEGYYRFDIHDQEDCRNHYPETVPDQTHIQEALQPTYEQFVELTQSEPQLMDPTYPYTVQWQHLQDQIDELHGRADGNLVPLLLAVGKWIGGVSNWRSSAHIHGEEWY